MATSTLEKGIVDRLNKLHGKDGFLATAMEIPMYSKSGRVIGRATKVTCTKPGHRNNEAVYVFAQ